MNWGLIIPIGSFLIVVSILVAWGAIEKCKSRAKHCPKGEGK